MSDICKESTTADGLHVFPGAAEFGVCDRCGEHRPRPTAPVVDDPVDGELDALANVIEEFESLITASARRRVLDYLESRYGSRS